MVPVSYYATAENGCWSRYDLRPRGLLRDGAVESETAMSFVAAVPETLATVSADVGSIGSSLSAAHASAASATTGVVAAAGDEVSAAIATLFSGHGQAFQQASVQAAAFHGEFVRALSSAGSAYTLTEAASATPLQTIGQDILGVINAPTNLLLGRPLIGNGTNGAAGTGQAGGAGGLLWGTGGTGGSGAPGQNGGAGGAAGLIGILCPRLADHLSRWVSARAVATGPEIGFDSLIRG